MKQWLVNRSVLATVPVAALVLAFGACSSETGGPGEQGGTDLTQPDGEFSGAEHETSPNATARLDRLSKRFSVLPPLVKEPARPLPPGAKPQPVQPPLEARPVVTKGDAERFVRAGSRLRAEVSEQIKSSLIKAASVDVPLSADGFVRVQPDGAKVGVEFATKGASKDAQVEVADGVAMYPGGGPQGSDLVLRVTGDSVEDFVVLNEKPSDAFIDYVVNASEVAGLRLYDNTLEFLDATGDPQVRVKPPRVADSDGVLHEAKLSLLDCKADTSGEVPWNRPVTAPGSDECTMRVSWDDKNVIYPAIVDPVWATAGSLATARENNSAIRLSTGFVLTCGGLNDLSVPTASCEQFNPAGGSGAGTWATSTAMNTARSNFTLLLLSPATTVLAVGGNSVFTSEMFNGTSWANSTGDFSAGSFDTAMPAMTSDGAYVVVIDNYGRPFRLVTSSNAWSSGTTNPSPQSPYRQGAAIVQIPGQGTILRVGGYTGSYVATAERYRPSTDSWSNPGNAASMQVPRYQPGVAVLDNTRLMVYGGSTGSDFTQSAEIYSASGNSWTLTNGAMPSKAYQGYRGTSAAFHGSGKLLVTPDYNSQPVIYDPLASSNAWSQIQTYSQNFYTLGTRGNAVAAGSKVLLVPVQLQGSSSGAQTACRLFDFGEKGALCSASSECQAGLQCVTDAYDGVQICCDAACSNPCMSCRATNKTSGTGDGTCGPRKVGQPMYSHCAYENPNTCGNDNYECNGAGQCHKWSTATTCGNGSCVDEDTQNDTRKCDGSGTCNTQTTTDCAVGYKCVGDATSGACVSSCYNDDYCTSSYFCQTWQSPYETCQPKKADGASCTYNQECKKGFCVDGVCCETECSGTCMACTNAATGQADGTCKPVKTAADPRGDCDDEGASSCGQNGACNGAGACQKYAAATVCVAANCASATARNVPDTCNGTGTCTDNGVQACATGYACISGACQTQCTTDDQCASDYHCDTANKQCVADKTQGQACARDAACSGNSNCVDGVCCDSACTGTCRSCLKNQTGLASDGLCGNILDDTDPASECALGAGYPQSCQAPGLCNGEGACRAFAKVGVECDTDSCAGSTLTNYECNGAGTCKAKATQCYPFQCDTANNVCRVACSVDTDCVEGSSCENGSCVGQLENGQACTRGPQCKTGFCANIGEGALQGTETGEGGAGNEPSTDQPGVCCDRACQGTCAGCKASIKGFGSDGVCEFVKNNTDPANDCEPSATDSCGLDGQCNGAGACRLAPSGTACGASSCQGNSVVGQSCNGQGDCVNNQGGVDCAPYLCRDVSGAFQCTNPCAEDNDCQDGYYCDEALCKKKQANGKACESSGVCSSGFCVDGVCCDTSCNGQCAACDVAGSEGVCTPVKGEPHGNRAKCDFAGTECGGACDGVNASSCKYAASGTSCGAATCDNGLAKSAECNGQGECRANKDTECSPYVCGEDEACLTRCEIDADCSQGYACDETTQRCLPSAVAAVCSDDRQTSIGQNGSTPCKPFLCVPASGTCAVSCAFSTDCAPDFVCEPSTKTCLPASADVPVEDESCACRAAGAGPTRPGYLALAAFGVALAGLRRRRQRPSPRSARAASQPGPYPS